MHLTMRSQFPLRKWVVSIAAASCDRLVAEAVLGGVCGQLDATEHAELAQEHGISGFPALRFFPAGLPVRPSETYDGELHAADLIEFLNEVRVWDCVHAMLRSQISLTSSNLQRCGTHRRLDATLSEHAGRVAEIDVIVRKFLVSKHTEQERLHKGVPARV